MGSTVQFKDETDLTYISTRMELCKIWGPRVSLASEWIYPYISRHIDDCRHQNFMISHCPCRCWLQCSFGRFWEFPSSGKSISALMSRSQYARNRPPFPYSLDIKYPTMKFWEHLQLPPPSTLAMHPPCSWCMTSGSKYLGKRCMIISA